MEENTDKLVQMEKFYDGKVSTLMDNIYQIIDGQKEEKNRMEHLMEVWRSDNT